MCCRSRKQETVLLLLFFIRMYGLLTSKKKFGAPIALSVLSDIIRLERDRKVVFGGGSCEGNQSRSDTVSARFESTFI